MKLLAMLACACLAGSMAAQTEAVPITQEPDHHLVLENQFTRVFYVEVPVGEQTLVHEHKNDYVFVTLGDSDVENMPQGKDPVRLQLKDGEARYVKAPLVHRAKNLAKTPFRNVTIEILMPGDAGEEKRANLSIGGASVERISNNKVTVVAYRAKAHGSIDSDATTLPSLFVADSDLEITVHKAGRATLHSGDVKWLTVGTGFSVKGKGSQPLRFVVLAYK
jgi:hypothetical protein